MAKSIQLKEEGNRRFQAGDYVMAEALYSQALISDPNNPALYTNRAMARLKLGQWDSAEEEGGEDGNGGGGGGEEARKEVAAEWDAKIARMREVFEKARPASEKRRTVPDWAIDDISFCVMVDPVIVSGRSSLLVLTFLLLSSLSLSLSLSLSPSPYKIRQVLRARVDCRAPAPPPP
ncbi:hypothetical protein L209DRAFT_157707 [Thermothelomyces heterothallicus CBS 203.75]